MNPLTSLSSLFPEQNEIICCHTGIKNTIRIRQSYNGQNNTAFLPLRNDTINSSTLLETKMRPAEQSMQYGGVLQ